MGSCYVKTIRSEVRRSFITTTVRDESQKGATGRVRTYIYSYIPAGKLKGSLESLLIFKTMYSFYLNAHKTTMSCIKHFMRVELSES